MPTGATPATARHLRFASRPPVNSCRRASPAAGIRHRVPSAKGWYVKYEVAQPHLPCGESQGCYSASMSPLCWHRSEWSFVPSDRNCFHHRYRSYFRTSVSSRFTRNIEYSYCILRILADAVVTYRTYDTTCCYLSDMWNCGRCLTNNRLLFVQPALESTWPTFHRGHDSALMNFHRPIGDLESLDPSALHLTPRDASVDQFVRSIDARFCGLGLTLPKRSILDAPLVPQLDAILELISGAQKETSKSSISVATIDLFQSGI